MSSVTLSTQETLDTTATQSPDVPDASDVPAVPPQSPSSDVGQAVDAAPTLSLDNAAEGTEPVEPAPAPAPCLSFLEAAKNAMSEEEMAALSQGDADGDDADGDDADGDDADGETVSDDADADAEQVDYSGYSYGGQRPIVGAVQAYVDFMSHILEGCKRHLHARQDHPYADLKIGDPRRKLTVTLTKESDTGDASEDTITRDYEWHTLHYGPQTKRGGKRHWRWRDSGLWTRLGVYPPFRTLQVQMLEQGYYLVDESNPALSMNVVIRLHRNMPAAPLKLWHGYGVIPGLGPAFTPAEAASAVPFSQPILNLQNTQVLGVDPTHIPEFDPNTYDPRVQWRFVQSNGRVMAVPFYLSNPFSGDPHMTPMDPNAALGTAQVAPPAPGPVMEHLSGTQLDDVARDLSQEFDRVATESGASSEGDVADGATTNDQGVAEGNTTVETVVASASA